MNWGAPLVKTTKAQKAEDPLKDFKKPKCVISKGSARSIVGRKCEAGACVWIERWIDQLIRENSYPPQLKSDDFVSCLSRYFTPKDALAILERIRTDFANAFSVVKEDDGIEGLVETIRGDPEALAFLPTNYLSV